MSKGNRFRILAAALALLSGWEARAGAHNSIPGPLYLPARAAGMGDAFLTLADDGASGLFINPAAFASGKAMTADLLNVSLEANQDLFNGADINTLKATNLAAYAPTLPAGEYPGFGFTFVPAFSGPNVGFGILMQARNAASVTAGSVSYRSSYRFVPAVGVGTRLAGGLFKVGYSLQYINKAEGEVTGIPTSSSPLGYHQQLAQGSAISHNVGVSIAVPVAYVPTLSVVARNVLGATYKNFSVISFASNITGVPASDPMTVDLGFSLQPRFRGGGFMTWSAQVRDATEQSGFSLLDRTSLGFEANIRNLFALRAGYALGALHAGGGFRTQRAEINFAWHTEELGTPATSSRERRWMVQYMVKAF
jgi:hypothetical protein